MSTHNLCFELKYEKYQIFLSENLQILVVKVSIYLNRHVFVMFCEFPVHHEIKYRYEGHPRVCCLWI